MQGETMRERETVLQHVRASVWVMLFKSPVGCLPSQPTAACEVGEAGSRAKERGPNAELSQALVC